MLSTPIVTIQGAAAVRRYAVLPTKVQILTEDCNGDVSLWDVMAGTCSRRWKKAPAAKTGVYEELHKSFMSQQVAVPTWFTPSARSGSLEVTLEVQTCFNAEAYASDLAMTTSEEMRINLGERLLHAIFRKWAEAQPQPPHQEVDQTPELKFRELEQVPVCISDEGVVLIKTTAAQLPRAKADVVPLWVVQSVLHGHYAPRESLKLSFFLAPHPQEDLPQLPPGSNKLSAAKVLKLHKVIAYVEERLNVDQKLLPLRLVCNDKPLPPEMTLASVRTFVWKNGGEDMLIHYLAKQA
uniref:Uncharacterized protein n=1 Tax=Calcidiscus leptoporus TaxID=127549 RepID=A0A7S0J239_9EUKA